MRSKFTASEMLLVLLLVGGTPVGAQQESNPLRGEVNQQSGRVARPLDVLQGRVNQSAGAESGGISTDAFDLSNQKLVTQESDATRAASMAAEPLQVKQEAAAQARMDESAPRTAAVATTPMSGFASRTIAPASSSTAPTGINASPVNGGSGGGGESTTTGGTKRLSGAITFRFTYFDLGDGPEVTWEGLRDANYLLGKGVDVAVILDRAGVRLASKHNMTEFQLHRGSTEKMIKNAQMLRDFLNKGGVVYASERWCKQFGLWGGSLSAITDGIKLLSDEEMADLLVEREGRIINY